MQADIQSGIRELIDRGADPVAVAEIVAAAETAAAAETVAAAETAAAEEITARGPARQAGNDRAGTRPPKPRPRRIAAVLTAAAAVGSAAAIAVQLASPASGPAGGQKVILTAAMVRHVASASRSALANSGRAEISYRDTQDGVLQDTGTDDITFSGRNWNDAFSQTLPASAGSPAHTQFAINRIVNGQAYLYIAGRTARLQWYHDTNPANHPDISIPDPRTVLGVLEPSARFEVAGYQTVGGVRLEVLRATRPVQGAGLASLPGTQPGEHVIALRVWVDGHGVVHRMTLTLRQVSTVYPFTLGMRHGKRYLIVGGRAIVLSRRMTPKLLRAVLRHWLLLGRRHHPAAGRTGSGQIQVQVTTLTIGFLDIGQPQVITPPARSIPQFGLG
jgi:hypothetical protein